MAAGFNGARLHQKVFEPRFLYHADRLGYLVWGEYGNWGFDHSDIANLATFLPDWLNSVKRDCSHPSVIGWCPFNETWDYGPQRKHQDDEVLRIVYEETKRYDPTRPCIDTSGNYHVVTDIYDIHEYEQDPAIFKARYDTAVDGYVNERPGFECQKWDGKLPLFMSEYGGIGIKLATNDYGRKIKTGDWSYGNAATSYEEFYDRYRKLTHALLDNPRMMGFCYTQLTDVEQEKNGLYTYDGREAKFDMEIIREINQKKAAIED
jgi:beta-galactosidase/beta-glucuronidase